MFWSPNFLSVVFKKQELSQQVVARRQDLASSQREGATPTRTQHPARPGRGAQAPRCFDRNLCPPKLCSRGCAPVHVHDDEPARSG